MSGSVMSLKTVDEERETEKDGARHNSTGGRCVSEAVGLPDRG